MSKIQELKQILKEKASHIRSERDRARNLKHEGNGPEANSIHINLSYNDSQKYRCYHIAYCELRGKTREQIEIPRENNLPNQYTIDKIKQEYAWTPEESAAFEERKAKREALRAQSA